MKFIHISDVHIGASFKSASFAESFSLKRMKEIKTTFFKALRYAADNEIDVVLISGDLFDSEYLKRSEIENVFREINKLKCQIFIIAGNHDIYKSKSYWKTIHLNDNVHVFDSAITKVDLENFDVTIYGHSWAKYYYKEKIFDNVGKLDPNRKNILIAHGDIYAKASEYLPIDKNKLVKAGFDYVALGHIHKYDFVTKNIAYAGSLEPLDFGEIGKHGFILGEITENKQKFKFIPFSAREFKRLEIELKGRMSEEDIHSAILHIDKPDNLKKNMYRIILTGRYNHQIDLHPNTLFNLFNDDFNYVEFENKAKFDFDLELIKKENQGNIIEKYIEKFEGMDLENRIILEAFNIGLDELLNSKEGEE